MATPLRTSRRAVLAIAAAAGVLLAGSPAAATPTTPTTAAEAAELVAARGHELEALSEQFNEARETLRAQTAAAEQAQAQVAAATAQLTTAQEQVRGIARSAFTGDSTSSFRALMTSASAEEFVGRVTTLQSVAAHQSELLATAAAANEVATQAQAQAAAAVAEAQAQYDAVARQQADLEAQIAQYQGVYDRLTTQERQAVAAVPHERASRDEREEAPVAAAAPVVADSAAGQAAVDAAMAQRGKPYVWAAAGPGSFDCSGLTQYAYRAAGISLPHSSRMQAQMGQPVAKADLRPGDLVFFYSPISHVGIYIGNGQMVHAPTSGDVVKVAPLMGGYVGARRIAG
ncbi:NlpC/P60 family protein [Blastococcus sp. TF02A-30]|uniref:C40 family peptidase n=1 Tax=Blastococcus sp. TF02A-30 TaxID=2250580 RepID=UPI000DE93D41|nr:C40 family peptidase [Blastococcus sp. TF02A-30]RBY92848.1 NlpC/P60 family protein [Blastococcus sp. TF02A-30]